MLQVRFRKDLPLRSNHNSLISNPLFSPNKSTCCTGSKTRFYAQAAAALQEQARPLSEPTVIPGGKGKATTMQKGDLIKIVNTYGSQVRLNG